MGEWVYCSAEFRFPKGTKDTPSPTAATVTGFEWDDFGWKSDPTADLFYASGEFNYGYSGFTDSFELDELSAADISWVFRDPGSYEWDPAVYYHVAGDPRGVRVVEASNSSGVPGLFIPALAARLMSDEEIVASVRRTSALVAELEPLFQLQGDKKFPKSEVPSQMLMDKLIAADCDPDLLRQYATDPAYMEVVAEHPQTPSDVLSGLTADCDWRLACVLADNPKTPPSALSSLMASGWGPAIPRILSREDCPRDVLALAAASDNAHWHVQVLSHKNCEASMVGKIPVRLVYNQASHLLVPKGTPDHQAELINRLAEDAEYGVTVSQLRESAASVLAHQS